MKKSEAFLLIIILGLFYISSTNTYSIDGALNSDVLTYHIRGLAIPIKDISTFEPLTVNLTLYGADVRYFIERDYIKNLLKQARINMSINIKGIRIYYNCSEVAGKKSVTYVLDPDGWYSISIPVGPCIVRNIPLILKFNGEVIVKQINNSAFKVQMKAKLVSNFEDSYPPNGDYKVIVEYPSSLTPLINGSLEINLSYVIVNNTAFSKNEVIGFSPLYIVYPKNATEIKELYERELVLTFYGIPLKFKMHGYSTKVLERNITITTIMVYVQSSNYVNLMLHLFNLANFGFPCETWEVMYKGEPLLYNIADFALNLIIKRENVTQHITYLPDKFTIIPLFLYKDLTPLPYNPEGEFMEYRWIYPIDFRGIFFKFNLSNGENLWVVLWGDVEYSKDIDPYAIDIGFFTIKKSTSIDIKQILQFLVIIVLPICIIIYYFLRKK